MRLAPILLAALLIAPDAASANVIAIVVRVEVPVTCRTGADGTPDWNRKQMPPATDAHVQIGGQTGGAVIVRSIAP